MIFKCVWLIWAIWLHSLLVTQSTIHCTVHLTNQTVIVRAVAEITTTTTNVNNNKKQHVFTLSLPTDFPKYLQKSLTDFSACGVGTTLASFSFLLQFVAADGFFCCARYFFVSGSCTALGLASLPLAEPWLADLLTLELTVELTLEVTV